MRCTTALLALILAACSAGEASQPTPEAKRQQLAEQRQRVSDDRAREEVNSVTHRLANGELIMLEVPTGGDERSTFLTHCFVWRDAEYRTASLSCPSGLDDAKLGAYSGSGGQGDGP